VYLNSDPAHRAKVAHYINYSGSPDVGDVETLSISSEKDIGNTPHHATGSNVTTFTLTDEDHFAVAASTRSFVELFQYLRDEEPQYTDVQCGEKMVTLEGIAESFADNVPNTGTIEIREVGDTPQAAGPPVYTLTPDAGGRFGPIQVKRDAYYELKGFDEAGDLVGYQYFTQFKRSNRHVRLLSPWVCDKFVGSFRKPRRAGNVLIVSLVADAPFKHTTVFPPLKKGGQGGFVAACTATHICSTTASNSCSTCRLSNLSIRTPSSASCADRPRSQRAAVGSKCCEPSTSTARRALGA
jgi:hypothetical protein